MRLYVRQTSRFSSKNVIYFLLTAKTANKNHRHTAQWEGQTERVKIEAFYGERVHKTSRVLLLRNQHHDYITVIFDYRSPLMFMSPSSREHLNSVH